MGRRPSKNSNLPRGVRAREQRSGVIYYYYDAGGKPRREIPLGSNYVEAVRKWAELEAMPPSTVSKVVTFRYACEVYQQKYMLDNSPKTRREKLRQFPFLFEFFDNPPAPLEEIKPIHVRQYMAWRSKKRQDALREKGLEVKGDEGRVAANRDKALISHVWNAARAEGLTDLPNPCAGIKSFREEGRDVYVYDDMYSRVWEKSGQVLRDAMDLAYLLGGRVADVLKVDEKHIREGAIEVTQNKTNSKVRIEITGELQVVVDKILTRKRSIVGKIITTRLLVNEEGQPLTYETLRSRFDKAREDAGIPFAEFQFRDLRAKAGTDKTDSQGVRAAQGQLGHKSVTTTEIYVRKRRGQKVTPTK